MSLQYTILSRIPFDIRDAAKEILNAMLTSKNLIGWDTRLRLIVDDRVIPNTNVADLVSHVLYPHDERIPDPRGFMLFVQGLKDIGLEPEWVENEVAKSILESIEDDTGETTSEDDSDSEDGDESEDGQDESDDDESDDDKSEMDS